MKKVLLIILVCALYSPLKSQIWEQINSPYDYATVKLLFELNDELYCSYRDSDLREYVNLKYENDEWVNAPNDTIYSLLTNPHSLSQFENKIIISNKYGLYLSENYGENWEKIANPIEWSGQLFDVDISTQGIFGISIAPDHPLERYNEEEDKWEEVYEIYNDTTLTIHVHELKSNSTRLFALQQNKSLPSNSSIKLPGGLYMSSDKGITWSKALVDSALYSMYVDDETIIVSTAHGNIIISNDNGETWEVMENIGTTLLDILSDGNRLISGSFPLGIMESYDNGRTWSSVANFRASSIFKKNDKYYFIGLSNKFFEADSTFKNIRKVELIDRVTQVKNIYSYEDTLFITGSFRRGVQYSTDDGQTWDTFFQELDINSFPVDEFIRHKNTFVCTHNSIDWNSYYYSSDYGKSWGLYETDSREPDIINLLILEDKILINSSAGMKISKDGGKTHEFMDTSVIKRNYYISKVAKAMNGDLLAFSGNNEVFISNDNANSWKMLVDSLPLEESEAPVADFYEFDGTYFIVSYSTPPKVLKSTDEGESWQSTDFNFADKVGRVNLLLLNEYISISASTAGYDKGLTVSTDQGKSWKNIDAELPQISDEILGYTLIGVAGDYIYIKIGFKTVGVNIEQIYRTTLEKLESITSVETTHENLTTSPPYPQPARSVVTIDFDNKKYSLNKSSVTIFDMTGRKLENQSIDINNNSIQWDCSTAQPGIYLINIKHGTEEKAVKVLVE